ncbi:MAG: TIGR00159 family protein [Deltaproteobacteria bacterium]|nr:TIGR00159 family protein [Deltaproteobacteria bacterium]
MSGATAWIRWQDLVDILLVALVIYRVLLVIRGTRAVQILLGLAVLGMIFVVSEYLELFTLHWMLSAFLSSIILVVVVLFQNDIRRALAHVGTNSLWPYLEAPASDSQALDELMKAAVSLANKKIGALIVLQRGTNLRNHVEEGVKIDAEISKELLLSIFLPYSPIHDGAVIVKDGRILWAGCFLPLTSRGDLEKDLGTRHRAAVGITEDTDAVVIVVSEERGAISIVLNGRVTRDLDGAGLRRVLLRLFPVSRDAARKKSRGAKPEARAPSGEGQP